MTLYNIQDIKIENSIGTKKHWALFRKFRKSTLHRLFLSEIIFILKEDNIDSSISGKKILDKLKIPYKEIFNNYDENDIGGLYGMTLWNVLVKIRSEWYFKPRNKKDPILFGTIYWRKHKEDNNKGVK